MWVLKFPKLGVPRLWGPITLSIDLRLRWGQKQSCSPHLELSNGMLHATWMQWNRGNSWLLVVGSQIDNLTPDLSFGHNLRLKCPNGSCEHILDINVLRAFQWYKERFNPMSFDPCDCPLKIQESIGSPIPKMRVHFRVWRFIPHTCLHSWEHEMWFLGSILARTFANPYLGCKPKARVVTTRAIVKKNLTFFITSWVRGTL
jgi:hypothetical protein